MPISVNIRISSTSFVKVFTANGSSICFGGFCLPPVTLYMSCPKELTSRRTRWEYSVVISVLSVRKVQRKATSSGGRLTAFSQSSDGVAGHYVSVLFERTADVQANLLYFLDFRWSIPLSNCSDNVTIWPVEPQERFLWGTKRLLLLFRRSSNCNKTPNSFSNFFWKCFFVDWDFSVAPIDHMQIISFSLRSTILTSLGFTIINPIK